MMHYNTFILFISSRISYLNMTLLHLFFLFTQPIFEDLAGSFGAEDGEIIKSNNKNNENNDNNNLDEDKTKNTKIKIAKVDATKSKKIAKEYSVKSFPTIKYVKNGKMYDYTGIKTKERFSSFLKIMVKNSITEIKSLSELRILHMTNVISDSSPNNIIFLLNIVRQENLLNTKTEIENIFEQLSIKYQGKGIFVLLKTVKNNENIYENNNGNNDNSDDSFFSISKIEMNSVPIMFTSDRISEMNNDNNNNDNTEDDDVDYTQNNEIKIHEKINKNLINSRTVVNYNQIDDFFVKNNHPIISELSQRNFRVFSELKKIVIIAVVNENEISKRNEILNTDLISNTKEKTNINNDNNKENNEVYDKNLENFEFAVSDKKIKKNLNDFILGYLDGKRWKRFLLQYGISETGLLIIDFRSKDLVFYSQKFHVNNEKDDKNDNRNLEINEDENYDKRQQEKIKSVLLDFQKRKILLKLFNKNLSI
jgi:Thioredoxin